MTLKERIFNFTHVWQMKIYQGR